VLVDVVEQLLQLLSHFGLHEIIISDCQHSRVEEKLFLIYQKVANVAMWWHLCGKHGQQVSGAYIAKGE
jgi:hypothetical protein